MANTIEPDETQHLEKILNFGIEDENTELSKKFSALMKQSVEKKEASESTKPIYPKPGICIKAYIFPDKKLFLNVCYSDSIPSIPNLSEYDLIDKLVHEPCFKLPISIGDLRDVNKKDAKDAKVVDIAFNTELYSMIVNKEILQNYIMMIIINTLEEKYNIKFQHSEYKILTKKKVMDKIGPHYIGNTVAEQWKMSHLITEIGSELYEAPEFELLKCPTTDGYDFFIVYICLEGVISQKRIITCISPCKLKLTTNGEKKYNLEFYFSEEVNNEACNGTFCEKTGVLTIILPIVQKQENIGNEIISRKKEL